MEQPISDPNLWDQREKESDKSYATFLLYRNMGKGERSFRSLAEMTHGKSSTKTRLRQLSDWSSKFQWVVRVEAWDKHQQKISDKADQEAYTKARITARLARRKVANNILAMLDKQIVAAYENNDTQELVRLSTALAKILEQSRQEFNDLPTQPIDQSVSVRIVRKGDKDYDQRD